MDGFEFTGFPAETLKFLKDLKANNNREWFAANKKIYEQTIKFPAQAFCSSMCGQLHELTGVTHRSKVFRIHRDIRFSKDKTPYNAHLHISFFPNEKTGAAPGWFFGLAPEKLTLGAGVFRFDDAGLDEYRRRVYGADGEKLAKIVDTLLATGARLNEPPLKRVPSGFAKDHPREALLRRKGLALWSDMKNDIITKPDLAKNCATEFSRLKPVFDWFS